jgi:AraC-like DNA-binding protein
MHSIDYHDESNSVFTALVFNPILLAGEFDACGFYFQGIADQRILIDHKYSPGTPHGDAVITGLLEITDLLEQKPYAYEVRVKALLYGMFAAIFEQNAYHVQYEEHIGNPKNAEKIKQVVKYIYQNFNRKITIEDLSQLLNYSPYYFSRFFKELTGRTPIDYLNRYRSSGLRAPPHSEASISEAAFAVGSRT